MIFLFIISYVLILTALTMVVASVVRVVEVVGTCKVVTMNTAMVLNSPLGGQLAPDGDRCNGKYQKLLLKYHFQDLNHPLK